MNLIALNLDILKELGLDKLDETKQKDFLTKMNEVISQRVIYRLMTELNEDDKEKFDALLEAQASEEEKNEFLNGRIDLYTITMDEVADFKEKFLADMKAVNNL